MSENEKVAKLLARHYQVGRKELAEEIIKTIEGRKDRQDIGTLTRIYSYCKKQIKDAKVQNGEVKDEL